MTLPVQFEDAFEALTGHRAFPWQQRLYEEHFVCGTLPLAVDIPTGLGKTAVMAIWLLARAAGAPLPRRLVYVVDRRAVVDQATEFAERLRERLDGNEKLEPVRRGLDLGEKPLPLSTLRGRHADNREWMADPAAPAIVVGTVDMVGSRLLFEGYGLSRRMRPFAAGLLGCDALVILDEAHLARPFERLLKAIEEGQRPSSSSGAGVFAGLATRDEFPPLFRMLPLSATLSLDSDRDMFRLDTDDQKNDTVHMRLGARKSLIVEDIAPDTSLDQELAERAWELIQDASATAEQPPAIVIYCDRRTDAERVADRLRKRGGKGDPRPHTILFVGGRRVHERQKAAEELQEYGLVGDAMATRREPVFLVATSAGEVGVDLDAQHMVCDLVAWERMVQRLGRVNRRGVGAARVLVLDQGSPHTKRADAHAFDRKAVRALLDALPQDEAGEHQAGPGALMNLAIDPAYRARIDDATTLMPLYPALTRPLIDAWAMTSLENHAGRPEVAPWLRGWLEDEEPQTTLIWRRYLPLRFGANSGDAEVAPTRDVHAFFAAAPPQTEELLETETSHVVEWIRKRARKRLAEFGKVMPLPPAAGVEIDGNMVEPTHLLAPLTRKGPIAFVLDSANYPTSTLSLTEINQKSTRDLRAILSGKRLVVDARFGGIKDGLISSADDWASTIEDNWGGEDNASGMDSWKFKVKALPQNADVSGDEWRTVLEMQYCTSAEGDAVSWLNVQKRYGISQSEDAKAVSRKAQRLDEHQQWAGEKAARIADVLGLGKADKSMLVAATCHHDDGKAAPRWQRAFNAPQEGGPYAKTTRAPNQHLLNGYRHELKSTLDAEKNGFDGLDRTDSRFDLALHLIAAHHGHARPVIGVEGYDDLPPSEAEAKAHAIAVRFARLQREWGPWGLAWWEALLRAADQAASRRLDEEAA